jgi:hypothetical protein
MPFRRFEHGSMTAWALGMKRLSGNRRMLVAGGVFACRVEGRRQPVPARDGFAIEPLFDTLSIRMSIRSASINGEAGKCQNSHKIASKAVANIMRVSTLPH